MFYKITVVRLVRYWQREPRREHFFATAERSCTTEKQAREVYQEIVKRFPEPEFEVTVSLRQVTGTDVTWEMAKGKSDDANIR